MTQGITNSLNIALMRMNSIENSFSALERLSAQLSYGETEAISQEPKDFKTVLDAKILESQNKDENTNKINELVNDSPLEIPDNEVIKEQAKEKIIDSINLKSKIDLKSQSTNVEEIIEAFSNKYNIDSNFIKAIIKQESNFNAKATSPKGAMGLMQLMPKTAQALGVVDAYNPSQNIEGGIKYLRNLLNQYDNNKELALAAYNAGPNSVKKYGGIPPYKETQNYVNAIMSSYGKLKEAELGANLL